MSDNMVKKEAQTLCREHPGVESLGILGTESIAFQIATPILTLFMKFQVFGYHYKLFM
jgi:hypothetical protein